MTAGNITFRSAVTRKKMLNETSQPESYFVIVIKNGAGTKKWQFYLAIRFRAIVSELDKENSTGGGSF